MHYYYLKGMVMKGNKLNRYLVIGIILMGFPINSWATSSQNTNQEMISFMEAINARMNHLSENQLIMNTRIEGMVNSIGKNNTIPVNRPERWLIVLFLVLTLCVLFGVAVYARKGVIDFAKQLNDQQESIKFLHHIMNQTFGLPRGTIRGILTIIIAILFVSCVFLFSPQAIPDSIQIITAILIGFYFSKSTDQSHNLMKSLLVINQKREKKRTEALLSYQRAQRAGADDQDADFQLASIDIQSAEKTEKNQEAIFYYSNAIKLTNQAALNAIKKNIAQNASKTDQTYQSNDTKIKNHDPQLSPESDGSTISTFSSPISPFESNGSNHNTITISSIKEMTETNRNNKTKDNQTKEKFMENSTDNQVNLIDILSRYR